MQGQEEGLPFIRGLLLARKTLLEVRQKKVALAENSNSKVVVKVDNYIDPCLSIQK